MESRPLRLIDADAHVNEPPDLWVSRVAKQYVDRVPRMEHFPEGDAWVMEGVDAPINFGLNACAGLPADSQRAWARFDEIREGGWNPAARLNEMDEDGIWAAILYPTPRLSQGVVTNKDPVLQGEMVRAYNDWLSEYASADANRLAGIAILPTSDVKSAVAEYERSMQLRGIRGAVMLGYPHGTDEIDSDDDLLFAAVASSGLPLNIHAALNSKPPTFMSAKLPGAARFNDAPKRMLEFLWSGAFDRFPELRVAFIEVDCGWVPYFKEQADNRFHRMGKAQKLGLKGTPSEYFDRHCVYSFITDAFAVRNRHAVGLKNMMWSSDYPHVGSDWPNSWRTIDASFSGVPRSERELILSGNASRLYCFTDGPSSP